MPRHRIPRGTLIWCSKNGWEDPFYQEGKYWAYPPGGDMPLPVQPLSKILKDFANGLAVVLLLACTITALVWLGWRIIRLVVLDTIASLVEIGPIGITTLAGFSFVFAILSAIALAPSLRPSAANDERLSGLGLVMLSALMGGLLAGGGLLSSAVGVEKLIAPAFWNAVLFGIALLIVLYRAADR